MLVKNKFCSVLVVASMFLSVQLASRAGAQTAELDEVASIWKALYDLRKDIKVAEDRLHEEMRLRDFDRISMGDMEVRVLSELLESTYARLNNFGDVVRLRGYMAGSNDKRRLEAADAWINIRANDILLGIERSILFVDLIQKHAHDVRTERAASELRKLIRRLQRLWQSRKTSDLFPEQPRRD